MRYNIHCNIIGLLADNKEYSNFAQAYTNYVLLVQENKDNMQYEYISLQVYNGRTANYDDIEYTNFRFLNGRVFAIEHINKATMIELNKGDYYV